MSDQKEDSGRAPFHQEGGTVIFDKPKSEEESARQRREDEQHEFARLQVKTNKTLARFTGALVLATFCTIGVGVWQAKISRAASNAAQSAAETASHTLWEMQHGSGAQDTHTLAQQAVTQAKATTNLATAANSQAQIAERSLRIDQRSWLGIQEMTEASDESGQIGVNIGIVNSGRTPALNVRQRAEIDPLPVGQDPAFPADYSNAFFYRVGSRMTMPPNVPYGATQWSSSLKDLRNAKGSAVVYYAHGRIAYEDVFGKQHWIVFCSFRKQNDPLRPNQVFWEDCSSHNETDKEVE